MHKIVEFYGKIWKEFDWDSLERTKFQPFYISSEILAFKDKICLDAGCGSGRRTKALLDLGAGYVYGCDISKDAIGVANVYLKRAGYERKCEFQEGNVLDLPYKNDKFDYVLCNGVLHHTLDWKKGMQEIYRVLKEEGVTRIGLYTDSFRNKIITFRRLFRDASMDKKVNEDVISWKSRVDLLNSPIQLFLKKSAILETAESIGYKKLGLYSFSNDYVYYYFKK